MGNTEPGIEGRTASEQRAEVQGPVNLIVACTIAVMTAIGIGIAYTRGVPSVVLVTVLLIMSAIGVSLELLYYMHLRVAPERRLIFTFYGAGLGLALLMGIVLAIILNFVIPAH